MSQVRRLAVIACLAVLAILAAPLTATGPASAGPPGTIPVVPSLAACGDHGFRKSLSCGAAYTERWLAHWNRGDVVESTVITPPNSGGVWRSRTTDGVCVFGDIGFYALGFHHCDKTTFVVPRTDAELASTDLEVIAILAHESGHGFQERAGLDPVHATALRNTDAMFPQEQSADCWAGSAIAYYITEGMLPPTAVTPARALFAGIGQPGERGHGSGDQRLKAFNAGFEQGPAACNRILGRAAFPVP